MSIYIFLSDYHEKCINKLKCIVISLFHNHNNIITLTLGSGPNWV